MIRSRANFAAIVAVVALAFALAFEAGCGGSHAPAPATTHEAPEASLVPMRVLRTAEFSMQIPAGLPEPTIEGRMLSMQAPASKVAPTLSDVGSISIGISVYHQNDEEFRRRADIRDWASHPLPPGSVYRTSPLRPARMQTVKIPGGSDAAISVSEHDGIEALGTGGEKAVSLRLFVKPATGEGAWVIGAQATGDVRNPHLNQDGPLVAGLEESLRSFRLTR
jgi:hypothetical protein